MSIRRSQIMLGGGAFVAAALTAIPPAAAATVPPPEAETPGDVQSLLEQVQVELKAQRALIAAQSVQIADQQRQIEELRQGAMFDLGEIRGTGMSAVGLAAAAAMAQVPTGQPQVMAGPSLPDAPVGERPPETEVRAEVQAIPQDQGVLTPAGMFVFDPSIEYTRSSKDRLVFRGIELIPGIQIGLIEATEADRDTIVGTASLRYGLTDRLEVEARIPYLYRNDKIEVVQQRDEGIVRNIKLREDGIGDAEVAIRYQINDARPLHPIWVASLRVKSDTGKGPFDIGYDEFGVATGLATGSGFWGVQPGVSFLLPSDPVVIYGGMTYLYHMPRDVNRFVGEAFIGHVDPGDAIGANIGFGFALNPRFSYSLGYRHSYIFPSKTEIGETVQKSSRLQVGSLNFGMSYRVTEKQTLNLGFEFGVTEDAPDVSITLRMPFAFSPPFVESRRD
jgi:hypothetical protein